MTTQLNDELSCYEDFEKNNIAYETDWFNQTYSYEDRVFFDQANAFLLEVSQNYHQWLDKHDTLQDRQNNLDTMLGDIGYTASLDKDYISQTYWYSVDITILKDGSPYILIWQPCDVDIQGDKATVAKVSFLNEPVIKEVNDYTLLLPNYDCQVVKIIVNSMIENILNKL